MKLKMISFLLIAGTITATAQNKNAIQKVYDTYEDAEGVYALSFSKNMTNALDGDFEWGDELKNIEGDITKMSTLIVSENNNSRKMLSDIEKMIKRLGYSSQKMKDEDGDHENGLIFTRGNKGNYSEIHLLMTDTDGSGILVSLFGKFHVTDAH